MKARLGDLPSRTIVWYHDGIQKSLYYILPRFPESDGQMMGLSSIGIPNLVKDGFVAFTAETPSWHLVLSRDTEVEVLQVPC